MRRYCPICDHDMPQGSFCWNCKSFVKPITDNGTYYLNRSHTDSVEHNKNCEFHQYETHTDNKTTFSLNENRIEDYDVDLRRSKEIVSNLDAAAIHSGSQNKYTSSSKGRTYTASSNATGKSSASSGSSFNSRNTSATAYRAGNKARTVSKKNSGAGVLFFFFVFIVIIIAFYNFVRDNMNISNNFFGSDSAESTSVETNTSDYGRNTFHIDTQELYNVITDRVLNSPVSDNRVTKVDGESAFTQERRYYEEERDVWVIVFSDYEHPGAYLVQVYGYDKVIVKAVMLDLLYNSDFSEKILVQRNILDKGFYGEKYENNLATLGKDIQIITYFNDEYYTAYIQ